MTGDDIASRQSARKPVEKIVEIYIATPKGGVRFASSHPFGIFM
jgi:hypothetical protein